MAADVVVGLAKLGSDQAPDDEERKALLQARELLAGVADFGSDEPRTHLLLSGGGALDALEAVERNAGQEDSREWVRELGDALERAFTGSHTEGDDERLGELRDLFVSLAKIAVARANGVMARREDPLRWTGLRTTSSFS